MTKEFFERVEGLSNSILDICYDLREENFSESDAKMVIEDMIRGLAALLPKEVNEEVEKFEFDPEIVASYEEQYQDFRERVLSKRE